MIPTGVFVADRSFICYDVNGFGLAVVTKYWKYLCRNSSSYGTIQFTKWYRPWRTDYRDLL